MSSHWPKDKFALCSWPLHWDLGGNHPFLRCLSLSRGLLAASCLCLRLMAQQPQTYTWQQLREKFEAANPTLRAGQLNIDESRAQEITAYLRPNPDFTVLVDQIDPFSTNPYRPFQFTEPLFSSSYLHEREHKRELRLESA